MSITFLYKLLISVIIIYISLSVLDTLQMLIQRARMLKIKDSIEAIKRCEEERLHACKEFKEKLENMNKISKHTTLP